MLDDPDGYVLLFQQWTDGHAPDEEPPVANTIPVLAVADLQAAIAFYTQKLGFGLDCGGAADSRICSVGSDNRSIMLRQESRPRPGEVWIGGSGLRAHWQAAQSDPAIQVLQPPTNQPWALEMRIADPDGNVLWFGTDPLQDIPFGTICPNP